MKLRAHLFDSQAFLMHVTQVEHGLRTVLLLWCQSVVDDSCLIVHISPVAIEVVVPQFYPCHCVTWESVQAFITLRIWLWTANFNQRS